MTRTQSLPCSLSSLKQVAYLISFLQNCILLFSGILIELKMSFETFSLSFALVTPTVEFSSLVCNLESQLCWKVLGKALLRLLTLQCLAA